MKPNTPILESFDLGNPVTPTCPECDSPFFRTLVPFVFEGRRFGFFPADVCRNGHEYFTEESRGAIQTIAKALGLWGFNAVATAQPLYAQTRDKVIPEAEEGYLVSEALSSISMTLRLSISGRELKHISAVPTFR